MSRVIALADHLAPDSISRLERAAEKRYDDAERLLAQQRSLAAVYFFGYSVEMCLTAAYYRSAGFPPNMPIDRDTRQRRMTQARQLQTATGQPLMNRDPHPLVGWARFLEWQRSASRKITPQEGRRLKEAIMKAELVYKHWRPELRYKTLDVLHSQLDEVRKATAWFLVQRGRL